jgi:hypothetical protein
LVSLTGWDRFGSGSARNFCRKPSDDFFFKKSTSLPLSCNARVARTTPATPGLQRHLDEVRIHKLRRLIWRLPWRPPARTCAAHQAELKVHVLQEPALPHWLYRA